MATCGLRAKKALRLGSMNGRESPTRNLLCCLFVRGARKNYIKFFKAIFAGLFIIKFYQFVFIHKNTVMKFTFHDLLFFFINYQNIISFNCRFHIVILPVERMENFLSRFFDIFKGIYYTMTLQFDGNFKGVLI